MTKNEEVVKGSNSQTRYKPVNKERILEEVLTSKKYSSICAETVERICQEEMGKYKKEKEVVKSAKNRLHQISDSFFVESGAKITKGLEKGEKVDYLELLKIHSSTNERLSFYEEMYDDLFAVTGAVDSFLDLACGLNPIMLGEYNSSRNQKIAYYQAEDIHTTALTIVQHYYQENSLPVVIREADILSKIPTVATDVVLLFKIIPLLEQQKKDYYRQLINELQAKYIVVTFPTKTMSGKSVGMLENYTKQFDEFVESSGFQTLFRKSYRNELLYIITR